MHILRTRQKLAMILHQAEDTGNVIIRRKDDRAFALVPEKIVSPPLEVPLIRANIAIPEVVDMIRDYIERQHLSVRRPGIPLYSTPGGGFPVVR
jgi:antitoxin Phd